MTVAAQPSTAESARLSIPPLIRRNTVLMALALAFTGAGIGLVYSIGPLMIVGVSGVAALSGLSVTLMGLSRFLIAYPVGKITDAHGRKPAMLVGLACALVGAILVGTATLGGFFPLLVLSMLGFGMGINAAQQLRVAATDMYPPSRRAEGLGYVLTGSLVGVVIGPGLVTAGEAIAPTLGVNPLGVPWLLLPVLIIPGMLLISRVHPDPRQIAERLSDYYPGYQPPPTTQQARRAIPNGMTTGDTTPTNVTLGAFLRHHPRRVAVITNVAAQGNMAIVMVSSSLLLHYHGNSLAEIAVSMSLHSVGMWAFSVPIGRLADRVGRRLVLLAGGITATFGAVLATQATEYWSITLGAFLVGVGWSGANVASTVVVADTTQAYERGRGMGLNDSMAAAMNMIIPMVAGPMGAVFGVPSTGLLAAAVMVPALVLLFTFREPSPGTYRSTFGGAAEEEAVAAQSPVAVAGPASQR